MDLRERTKVMEEVAVVGLMLAGNWLIALAGLAAWSFVLMYRRVDWRANAMGKFLMRFILLVAIILTWSVVANFFTFDPFVRAVIRFAIFLAILIELSLLNALLLHYEKKARLLREKTVEEEQFNG